MRSSRVTPACGRWRSAAAKDHSAHPQADRRARAGTADPVRLGARGFAALYAGTPMATLRRAGLAAGGDASADDALDGAFAGQAFMLVSF